EEDIAFKLREMAETIDLARGGRVDEAIEQIRTDRGKAAMDDARAFFDAFLNNIDEMLATSDDNQRGNLNNLRWVSIGGGMVILLVVLGAIWTVWRYTQELRQARQAVEEANTGLEERVRERTSDLGKAN